MMAAAAAAAAAGGSDGVAVAVAAVTCARVIAYAAWLPNLKPMKTTEIYTLLNCALC